MKIREKVLNIDVYNIFRGVNERLTEEEIRMMKPLSLAYIGDAVFELLIRTEIMTGQKNAHKLHKESANIVNAKAQADFFDRIKENLTEEELSVVNRAKNSKLHTMPRNAEYNDYRFATGLESLFGYHYLMNNDDRLMELYNMGKINNED